MNTLYIPKHKEEVIWFGRKGRVEIGKRDSLYLKNLICHPDLAASLEDTLVTSPATVAVGDVACGGVQEPGRRGLDGLAAPGVDAAMLTCSVDVNLSPSVEFSLTFTSLK